MAIEEMTEDKCVVGTCGGIIIWGGTKLYCSKCGIMYAVLPSRYQKEKERIQRQVLSYEQIKKLLLSPRVDNSLGKAVLETLYSTGISVEELVSLNLKDIDFLGEIVTIKVKNREEEVVPISSSALEIVKSYRDATQRKCKGQAFFVNGEGQRFSPSMLEEDSRGYFLVAGMNSFKLECLRHTFAVHMLKRGADLKSVEVLMRNVSISHLHIYEEIARSVKL